MFSIIISEKGGDERRESFEKPEINVGRVQGNDLVLPKGNVSKHHARLLFRDGRFIVNDLKSTNGTYVNGRKIAQATIVREGDKVYIGDFVIRVDMIDGSEEAPLPAEAVPSSAVPGEQEIPTMSRDNPMRGSALAGASQSSIGNAGAGQGAGFGSSPPPHQPSIAGASNLPPRLGREPSAPPPAAPFVSAMASGVLAESMPVRMEELPEPAGVAGVAGLAGGPAARRTGTLPRAQTLPIEGRLPRPGSLSTPAQAAERKVAPPAIPSQDSIAQAGGPFGSPGPIGGVPGPSLPSLTKDTGFSGGGPRAFSAGPSMVGLTGPAQNPGAAAAQAAGKLPQRSPEPLGSRPISSSRGASDGPLAGKRLALLSLMKRLSGVIDVAALPAQVEANEVVRLERMIREQALQMHTGGEVPEGIGIDALVSAASAELFGLGPLANLLDDDLVSEIHCLRYDNILVLRAGTMESAEVGLSSDASAKRMVMRLTEETTLLNEGTLERHLASGAHLVALVQPGASGVTFTLRKARMIDRSLEDMVRERQLSHPMAQFLESCFREKASFLIVSRGRGVGVAAALASLASQRERIVASSDAEQVPNGQGHTITISASAASVRSALRLRPDRLFVLSESSGAFGAGTVGALGGVPLVATVIAANAQRGMQRAAMLCVASFATEGERVDLDCALRMVAEAFDIVIECDIADDGHQSVTRISEPRGQSTDTWSLSDIFSRTDSGSFQSSGRVPKIASELRIDATLFRR